MSDNYRQGPSNEAILDYIFNPGLTGVPTEEKIIKSDNESSLYPIDDNTLKNIKSLEVKAINYAERKEIDNAIEICDQIIKLNNIYAPIYNNRAQIYQLNNNNEAALSDLNKAIELATKYDDVMTLKQAYTQSSSFVV